MTRRMATHNYSRPGIYHITIHVAEGMGQPLGQIEGSPANPEGNQNSPQMVLTPIGNMVREELLSSITDHYRMITVDTFVVMPEHLHALLIVKEPIVSRNGRPTHLGQVIAGFKKGCNRRYTGGRFSCLHGVWRFSRQKAHVLQYHYGPPAPFCLWLLRRAAHYRRTAGHPARLYPKQPAQPMAPLT